MAKDMNSIIISPNDSIRKAMKVIDETGLRCVLVVDEARHLLGIITDGDIRKHILKEVNLNLSVRVIMNTHPIVLRGEYSLKEAKEIMITAIMIFLLEEGFSSPFEVVFIFFLVI